jgi:hypothetical protein
MDKLRILFGIMLIFLMVAAGTLTAETTDTSPVPAAPYLFLGNNE